MEEQILPPTRRPWVWGLIGCICALALLLGALWFLFLYNTFSISVRLLGGDEIRLEYGSVWQEPGAEVYLQGDRILTEGYLLDTVPEIRGVLSEDRVGEYRLTYEAEFLGLTASANRRIFILDTQAPVIELVPDPANLRPSPVYPEAGFSAWDNYDGDITDLVTRAEREGSVTYTVTDSSGNTATVVREIPRYDSTPPVLTLTGGDTIRLTVGTHYEEPGYSAIDGHDGDLTDLVSVQLEQEEIVWYLPGTYTIRYDVADNNGNVASAVRTVILEPYPKPNLIYPKGKTIYLTFDDGPGPDTERLLNLLARYNVHATFFVVDTGYPELLRRIVYEGHSIGIHTRSHKYNEIYASPEAFFDDLFGMQKIILDATGQETWLMRFPGGSSNLVSSFNPGIMTLLTQSVQDMGFAYFDWNVDSNDAGGATTRKQVVRNVEKGCAELPISVVLQHDIHSWSVDAVEEIILWGLNNGYTFQPLQVDSPEIRHTVQN